MSAGLSLSSPYVWMEMESRCLFFSPRPASLAPRPGGCLARLVGGLIDGVPGFGSLISGPAKRSSSATYQPYKHPPQTLCFGGTARSKWRRREGGRRIRNGGEEGRREGRGGEEGESRVQNKAQGRSRYHLNFFMPIQYLNFGINTKKLTFITLFVPELEQELYLKKMQKCTFAKNWQNFDLNQELLPRK